MFVNQKFPAVTPWMQQQEQYLIVSDKDTSSLPAQRKKMLIIPAALMFDSEIPVKEPSEVDQLVQGSEVASEESSSSTEKSQLLAECPSSSLLNAEEANQHRDVAAKTVQPFGNGGYVDIPRPEDAEEESYSRVNEVHSDDVFIVKTENVPHTLDIRGQEGGTPEDYSRVKEVNSENTVFLEKRSDSSVKGKGYIDWVTQNSKHPQVAEPSEGGVCAERGNCEYVDTVPQPASI